MNTVSDTDKSQDVFRRALPTYLTRDYDAACSWALCSGHEEKETDWALAVQAELC